MHRLISLVILIICISFSFQPVFAQGEYLEGKTSGLGVAASVSGGEDVTVGGLSLGYSFASIFDFSLGAGLAFQGDRSEKAVSPRATIWILRENRTPNVKVTFGLSASGTYYARHDDKEWSVLGILMKRIYTDGGDFFQPWVGAGPGGANGSIGKDNGWLMGGGLDIVYRTSDHSHFFISPYFFRNNRMDVSSGGISIGLAFDIEFGSTGK